MNKNLLKSSILIMSSIIITVVIINKIYYAYKKEDRIGLVAVGDIGTGNKIQYQLAKLIGKKCNSKCEGIFLLGDVIYPHGVDSVSDLQFINKFELPFANIHKPFFIALGNHDVEGCSDCFIKYSSQSAKWNIPANYYQKSFGNIIDTFVIDTNNFSQNQKDWLINSLKKSKSKWKIVFGHHPLSSHDKRHTEKENPFKTSIEESICNKVDAYITGHDHGLYDLGNHCGVRLIISGGGSAPLGDIIQNNVPFFLKNYGLVEVNGSTKELKINFFNLQGKTVYSWVKN